MKNTDQRFGRDGVGVAMGGVQRGHIRRGRSEKCFACREEKKQKKESSRQDLCCVVIKCFILINNQKENKK